jgi:hypothetical protein
MRPGRAIRLVFALSFVVFLGVGCGETTVAPNVDAEGKAQTAPPPPNRKAKKGQAVKHLMPLL